MTKNQEKTNDNSLYAWATGKLVGSAIGLAVGVFIYKSGIVQKTFGKLFRGDPSSKNNSNFSNQKETNTED